MQVGLYNGCKTVVVVVVCRINSHYTYITMLSCISQVTGYSHRDENNLWRIKPAAENLTTDITLPDAEPQLLFTGSYIRLEHVL